mgnify:CR=1 FL=1
MSGTHRKIGSVPAADIFAKSPRETRRRVAEEVAPLMCAGRNAYEIAETLDIDLKQAKRYMQLCNAMWQEQLLESMNAWKGRVFGTYEVVLRELFDTWEKSKSGSVVTTTTAGGTVTTKTLPPDPRWLAGVVAVTKEVSVLLGMRTDAPVVAINETSSETRAALAPLSADAYLNLLAQNGGSLNITASPPPMASAIDVEVSPLRQSNG